MATDTELLDFLADPAQNVAQVLLPREIVERNGHSLRDGIREAKRQWEDSTPPYRRCDKCTAHLPPGKHCAGADCPLRIK